MICATKGKVILETLHRERLLPSGIWMADKIPGEASDNVGKIVSIGRPVPKSCRNCQDKMWCRKKCAEKGKMLKMEGEIGDICHFRGVFGKKFNFNDRKYVAINYEDIIALETAGNIRAVGSMLIAEREFAKQEGSIVIPDNAKQNSGNFWGNVIAIGPDYPDKSLNIGDKALYDRGEGYKFKTYAGGIEYYAIKERWIYGKKREVA